MNDLSPGRTRAADVAAHHANPSAPLPRLAIVSTFDELCGIACYTRALTRQLAPFFDVTVFELDQYLTRSTHRSVQRLADLHVRDIARQIAEFEFVNIQLEHGTLGRSTGQILRRFTRLADSARGLSVTFHTVFPADPFEWELLFGKLATARWSEAFDYMSSFRRSRSLSQAIYAKLRRLSRRKPVRVIAHTRRDMRLMRDVFRLGNVSDHPLSFVTAEERAAVRARAGREALPLLRDLPPQAKLIGMFGFLSAYKGFETSVRALRHLPADYHLLIFGGIHPQTIRKHAPIDPYLQTLLDEAFIDRTVFDQVADGGAAAKVTVSIDGAARELLADHPKSLAGRVHFMGALRDDEFLDAMAVCDSVVMAYLEVGQSASGPISQALELGCRVIASRTTAFLQFARYHPDQFEFFDIGNHLELAERLKADSPIDCANRRLSFNTETNAALYASVNAPAGRNGRAAWMAGRIEGARA